MKSRLIWIAVVVVAMAGFYYSTIRPALTPSPRGLNKRIIQDYRPPDIPPPPLPEPKFEIPSVPLPLPATIRVPQTTGAASLTRDNRTPDAFEVPIQDRATIDFSIGAPVIRSQGEDKVALEKALKEMAEATKDVTFGPSTPVKK